MSSEISIANTSHLDIPFTIQKEPEKPLGFCARLAYGTVNCVKKFGLGVAVGIPPSIATRGIVLLGQKVGVLPPEESLVKEMVEKAAKDGIFIDGEAIRNAPCPMQEIVNQFNNDLPPDLKDFQLTPFIAKAIMIGVNCVYAPIWEELVFRGLLQDILLTRLPKAIIKKLVPGKEAILDTSAAKATRIFLTSIVFAAMHMTNVRTMANAMVVVQVVASFFSSIVLGLIKESNAGLLGSIGAHAAHNFVQILPQLMSC